MEGYIDELVEKSGELAISHPEIEWHFVGKVPVVKVRELVSCPNLTMVESVDSRKLAAFMCR